uniref:Glycosyl transferase family 1 domain-containing protein n=1 Tax=Tetraselmis sp. GSL018 TaxID=582737 RepID=A0A061R827_9CHLO
MERALLTNQTRQDEQGMDCVGAAQRKTQLGWQLVIAVVAICFSTTLYVITCTDLRTKFFSPKILEGRALKTANWVLNRRHKANTLVVYQYVRNTSTHKNNFLFFFKNGVFFREEVQYVFLTDEDGSADIPRRANVEVVTSAGAQLCLNASFLWGAYVNLSYDNFVLLSSGTRGPFIPHYFPREDTWVELLTRKLDDSVRLVGAAPQCRGHESLESSFESPGVLALDRAGLKEALLSGAFQCNGTLDGGGLGCSVLKSVLGAGHRARVLGKGHAGGADWPGHPHCCPPCRGPTREGLHPYDGLFVQGGDPFLESARRAGDGLAGGARGEAPPSPPRRLLRLHLVTHNLQVQGAPRVLLDLALLLRATGRYAVTASSLHPGPLSSAWDEAGIPMQVLADIHGEIQEEAGANDAILLNTVVMAPVVRDMPARLRARTVWAIHESELRKYAKEFPGITRGLLHAPARVLFVSHVTRAAYSAFDRGHFRTILNWVNSSAVGELVAQRRGALRRRLALPAGAFVVTSVGTLCERKDQMLLVKAVKAVLLEAPELRRRLRVVLVGRDGTDPEYEAALDALIESAKLKGNVVVEPAAAAGVWDYLAGSDLHVSTSRHESLPLNIMEAMAAGVPVVATAVNGVVELIEHGVDGVLIQPGDHKALAESIRDAALRAGNTSVAWERLAAAGARAMAERFPPGRALGAYDRLFLEVYRGWSSPAPPPGKVCVVVRTSEWDSSGFYTLEGMLRSLQAQHHTDWEALVANTERPAFPSLPRVIGRIADPRIRLMQLKRPAKNHLETMPNITDSLIERCSPEASWLLVTHGNFQYAPEFLSQAEPGADIVAVNWHGARVHNRMHRGRLCERWQGGTCITNVVHRRWTDIGAGILNLRRWRSENRSLASMPADPVHGSQMLEALVYDEWRVKHVYECLVHKNPNPLSCHNLGGVWRETTHSCISQETAAELLKFPSHFIYKKRKLPFTCIQEFHP